MKRLLPIIIIAIVAVAGYANSLGGQFVWDDRLFVNNAYVKNWSSIPKLFTEDIGSGASTACRYYRPMQLFTHMVEYHLWKLKLAPYHVTNIVLHIMAAICIYFLILALTNSNLISFLTSLFFVIHPVHAESVMYIIGRAEILSAIFVICCLIIYIKDSGPKTFAARTLMVVSYIFALLSKENSLVLPALILLYHYVFKTKVRLKDLIPLLSVAGIYIFLRIIVFKIYPPGLGHPANFFAAIPGYIGLMFAPIGLHADYGQKIFAFSDLRVLFGIILFLMLSVYAAAKIKTSRLISFSILWFFIALLPVCGIYPIYSYMAERYLYLPSIGFFLLAAYLISGLYAKKNMRNTAISIIVIVVGICSYLTFKQAEYWKDPVVFYNKTLEYVPKSATVLHNLGTVYRERGEHNKAVDCFKKAIAADPSYADAYNSLGAVYIEMGRNAQAYRAVRKALMLNPNFVDAYNNMGVLYTHIGKYEEAERLFLKSIKISPSYIMGYNNLAVIYFYMGDYNKSKKFYRKVIQLDPDYRTSF